MINKDNLNQKVIAISISESSDMPVLGLSDEHLTDAMTEIARHLLAAGCRVAYGGDLRSNGFTQLLFELVARYRRDTDEEDESLSVLNYLSWPVALQMSPENIGKIEAELRGIAEFVFLSKEGDRRSVSDFEKYTTSPSESDWCEGLTSMRNVMLRDSDARIVLGGKVDGYKGQMPGIAEEALLSIENSQPLFILGGFGGCARDIAKSIGLLNDIEIEGGDWSGRDNFNSYEFGSLNNGLNFSENCTLAKTPHIDQCVALILTGLFRTMASNLE